LLVVAVMLGVCSIMGLPWFVAATVLSISHVNSLKVGSLRLVFVYVSGVKLNSFFCSSLVRD
jgi:hypothetical protein